MALRLGTASMALHGMGRSLCAASIRTSAVELLWHLRIAQRVALATSAMPLARTRATHATRCRAPITPPACPALGHSLPSQEAAI